MILTTLSGKTYKPLEKGTGKWLSSWLRQAANWAVGGNPS